MSGGTKLALVALLVLIVVVIARLVRDESALEDQADGTVAEQTEADGDDTVPTNQLEKKEAPKNSDRRVVGNLNTPPTPRNRLQSRRSGEPQQPRRFEPRPISSPEPYGSRYGADPTSSTPRPGYANGNPRRQLPAVPTRREDPLGPPKPRVGGNPPVVTGDPLSPILPISPDRVRPPESEDEKKRQQELAERLKSQNEHLVVRDEEPAKKEEPKATPTQKPSEPKVAEKEAGKTVAIAEKPKAPSTQEKPSATITGKFPKVYVVQPGDLTWNIVVKEYGSGRYMNLVKAANPGRDLGLIRPGDKLDLPAIPLVKKKTKTDTDKKPDAKEVDDKSIVKVVSRNVPSAGTREYRVKRGDTMWGLGRRHYGSATTGIGKLKELNPPLSTRVRGELRIGEVIRVPTR